MIIAHRRLRQTASPIPNAEWKMINDQCSMFIQPRPTDYSRSPSCNRGSLGSMRSRTQGSRSSWTECGE